MPNLGLLPWDESEQEDVVFKRHGGILEKLKSDESNTREILGSKGMSWVSISFVLVWALSSLNYKVEDEN